MPLIINGIALILFGLLAIYSTSVYESFTMSLNNTNFPDGPTNYYYFFQQLKAILYIAVVFLALRKFPIKSFKNHKFVGFIFLGAFILQILVFSSLGAKYNGARGWLDIKGLPSIQPSEFFKLAYVIFLASWLIRKKEMIKSYSFFFFFLLSNALIYLIFIFIPDFGTVLIIGATALIMARFAGLSLKRTICIFGIGIGCGLMAGLTLGLVNKKFAYIQNRFSYFFTTDEEKIDAEKETTGWQISQALIAIGGGGMRGNGYGNGLQKYSNLPESYCDFIFAAFSEEVGFFGNMILFTLYIRMFRYSLKHLKNVPDPQLKLIGTGILSLIIIQAFVNIGVNIDLLPTTGIALPFVSSGGSNLMVNCIELLLLYKIIQTENKPLAIK